MTGPSTLGRACCDILLLALSAKVSFPGSSTYNQSLASYFTSQANAVHPRCIVSPQTSIDVSAAVRLLRSPSTSGPGCKFAVRSGGHGTSPNVSNIQDGVVLDLRALDRITISESTSDVSVGAGATWGAVYKYLDPLGLSVAGGRGAGVGVGGLTLGGGISYFSPRYGWTCDSATGFEVVLASGSIIEANSQNHPQLASALRGGGNNFGIVTRIDFKTFSQGLVWSASSYHPLSTVEDQIREFVDIASADHFDEYASFLITFGYAVAQGLAAVANNLVYTKVDNTTTTPKVYQGLLSLPTLVSSVNVTSTTALVGVTGGLQENGFRQLYASITVKPTEAMLNAVYTLWNQSLASIQAVEGVVWAIDLEPLPPSFYARNYRSNALGLAGRQGTLVITQLAATWGDGADDAKVLSEARALMAAIETKARELNAFDPFVYANYAGPWQDPLASYGDISVRKLREVRSKVDPQGVFTYDVPGGFKLPP